MGCLEIKIVVGVRKRKEGKNEGGGNGKGGEEYWGKEMKGKGW